MVRRIGSACGASACGCIGVRVHWRAGALGHVPRAGASACDCEATAGHDLERAKGRTVRASVWHVPRALTAPITGSAVLRLLACYTAGGAIVKKPIWSCSPGWACDPIRPGSTARRVCGKLSSIGVSNTIGLSRIRRIGNVPILERRTSQP